MQPTMIKLFRCGLDILMYLLSKTITVYYTLNGKKIMGPHITFREVLDLKGPKKGRYERFKLGRKSNCEKLIFQFFYSHSHKVVLLVLVQ